VKLRAVILENFRSYGERVRIEIEEGLTALIGKNDVGKSTVLEALEIFFNSEVLKIGSDDPCVYGINKIVKIGCVFSDLPNSLVLDATAPTTLEAECLLNQDGNLEIYKIFDCGLKTPKASVTS
jgi:putative ATP-dependent endonuclease of OLD family